MQGPFALSIGSAAPGWAANLSRQGIYSLGRIFTYAVMGAAAGFGGLRLAHWIPAWANLPAILALLAGGLLIYQGLTAAGVIGKRTVKAGGPCLPATFFSSFLSKPGRGSLFLAGMFTGMLPCGLVYAFLALAASSASMAVGAATMTLFGLGTTPVMILAGFGGSLLTLGARKRVFQLAAWCVVLAGAVSIARGAGFLHLPGSDATPQCPLCADDHSPVPLDDASR